MVMFDGKLDPSAPIPLYRQLVVALESRIASGEVATGTYLPGEIELSEQYGVSRITTKRALDELAAAGLVTRARGRGTMVVARPAAVPASVEASIEGWLENVGHMQRTTELTLLDLADVPAQADVAAALDMPEGALVQRATRVRTLEGTPMSYLVTFLPAEVARGISAEDLGTQPLLKLLERAGHRVAEARQSITASAATPEIARALDVTTGAPLLEVRRTVRDTGGTAIQHIRALYRPDLYHIEMSLTRVGSADSARWKAETDWQATG